MFYRFRIYVRFLMTIVPVVRLSSREEADLPGFGTWVFGCEEHGSVPRDGKDPGGERTGE